MPAREVLVRAPGQCRQVRWKNGRGVTTELAIWPEGSALERGDFHWRAARARLAEAGPFSEFPGLERILIVIEGLGLLLDHGADAPRAFLRAFEPYPFPGRWRTTAELPHGPIEDLSLLYRPEHVRVQAECLRLGERSVRAPIEGEAALLLMLEGTAALRVTGEERPAALAPQHLAWVRHASPGDELELRGTRATARAVLVRVARQRA
jgi:hypothetical protein